MSENKWLVIVYNLPSEPSKLRVRAWRNLKKLGAINISQSMWILPYNEKNHSTLLTLSEELENDNGETFIMKTAFMEDKYEKRIISYFNAARKIEYEEIIDKCEDYFNEIEKETERKNFTFAEAEENEEELEKLLAWFLKIKNRDIYNSELRKPTEEALEKCKHVFEEFSTRVYEIESTNT